MPLLNIFKISLFVIVLCENIVLARTITKITNEMDTYITIKIVKSIKTKADLASNYLFLGLPKNNYPKTEIISTKKIKSGFHLLKNDFTKKSTSKGKNLCCTLLNCLNSVSAKLLELKVIVVIKNSKLDFFLFISSEIFSIEFSISLKKKDFL